MANLGAEPTCAPFGVLLFRTVFVLRLGINHEDSLILVHAFFDLVSTAIVKLADASVMGNRDGDEDVLELESSEGLGRASA